MIQHQPISSLVASLTPLCSSCLLEQKYHRLSALKNKHLFLTVLEVRKPKISCWYIWCLMRVRLIHRWPLSQCPHKVEGKRELSGGLFFKGANPSHECSTLMTQSCPKSPTSKDHHIGGQVSKCEYSREHNQSIVPSPSLQPLVFSNIPCPFCSCSFMLYSFLSLANFSSSFETQLRCHLLCEAITISLHSYLFPPLSSQRVLQSLLEHCHPAL